MFIDEIKKKSEVRKKMKKVQNFVPEIGFRETNSDPVKTKQNIEMTVYK